MKEKILLVSCNGLGNGGIQAVLMSIVENLSDRYVFDFVLFTERHELHEDKFLSYGGSIYRIPLYNGSSSIKRKLLYGTRGIRIENSIRKIIAEHGPYKAIHCNNYLESAYCVRAAAKAGVPIRITHIHAIKQPGPRILKPHEDSMMRVIRKHSTIKIACSDKAYHSYFGEKDVPSVIFNSYQSARFDPTRYDGKKAQPLTITQVGYYCDNKNQMFSLQVVAELKKRIPDVRLNLIGFDVGGHKRVLENAVEETGLSQNVTFFEHDADAALLYSQSHIAMVPSKFEGFGIVAVEAQAMNVHVFASDALPTSTDAGGCTYLPLSLGAAEWAKRIYNWYMENKDVPQQYDCSAFMEDKIMSAYIALYEGTFKK